MLVYRTGRQRQKRSLKLLHAGLHGLSFIYAVIGLKAVFDSHNLAQPNPIPNLYTLHSWLGLITVILFTGQVIKHNTNPRYLSTSIFTVHFRFCNLPLSRFVANIAGRLFAGTRSPRHRYIFYGNRNGLNRHRGKSYMESVSLFDFQIRSGTMTYWHFRNDSYALLPPEGVLVNIIGVLLLCYGVLSLYLVNDVSYKRVSLPEENMTLADNEEQEQVAQ